MQLFAGGGIIWKKQSSGINRCILANQGDMYFGRSTADDNSGSTYDMFIKRTGEVGIATTSPSRALHVKSLDAGFVELRLEGGSSGGSSVEFYSGSVGLADIFLILIKHFT